MYKVPNAIMENGFLLPKLSQREIEMIVLLSQGLSQSEIASKLFLSRNTIKNHIANANNKTNTVGTIPLIMFYVDFILSKEGKRPFSSLCLLENEEAILPVLEIA